MSFSANLEFGSDKYVILDVDYEFTQTVDTNGRPNGKPKGGTIHLSVESSKKNDLLEWMLSQDMKKTGTITFSKRDSEAVLKTIQFDDAFCVRYRERFSSTGNSPMILSLTISAGHLSVNNKFSMKNSWSTVVSKISGIGYDAGLAAVADFKLSDIKDKDMLNHPNRILDDVDAGAGAKIIGDKGGAYASDLKDAGAIDLNFGKKEKQPEPTVFTADKDEEDAFSAMDGLPGVSFS